MRKKAYWKKTLAVLLAAVMIPGGGYGTITVRASEAVSADARQEETEEADDVSAQEQEETEEAQTRESVEATEQAQTVQEETLTTDVEEEQTQTTAEASTEETSAAETTAAETQETQTEETETEEAQTQESAEASAEETTETTDAAESEYTESEEETVSTDEEEESGETVSVLRSSDDIASDSYGDITWVIDKDGVLTVEGTGEFSSISYIGCAPWYDYREYIVKAVVTLTDVQDLSHMFYGCEFLEQVDLSGLDTSNVTRMEDMFYNCSSLTSVDVSGFDTGNVMNMGSMFYGCSNLTSLDLSSFNTSNVSWMGLMFYNCSSLTSVDVSGFDTGSVTNMSCMFQDCSSLTSVDVSGFDTSSVTSMHQMFYNCSSLTSLDVSGFNTSDVTSMRHMFCNCSSLTSLDVSGFNTSNVTDMCSMFQDCSSLTSVDVSGFDTSSVTEMELMFQDCSSLTSVDVSGFDTSSVTYMYNMFYNCSSLTNLDVSGFDTSSVTHMQSMFQGCSSLTNLDVSGFNTSNVTGGIYSMFSDCSSLESIDVSGFDISSVRVAEGMFENCTSLKEINLNGLNTSNVTQMYNMFRGCSSLTSVDLSSLDTSSVTSMACMFYGCSSLTSVDMSGIDTKNVTSMTAMFDGCSSLTSLDLSSLDMSALTNASCGMLMFTGLTEIKAPLNVPDSVTIILPTSNGTWYREDDGSVITELPQGLNKTVRLYLKESGTDDGSSGPTTQEKTVTLSVSGSTTRAYNGAAYNAVSAVTVTYNNKDVTDKVTLEAAYTGTTLSGNAYGSASGPSDAGTYSVTVSVADNDAGYTGSLTYGFAITPAEMTVTPDDVSLTTADSLPAEYAYTLGGCYDDAATVFEVKPELTCDVRADESGALKKGVYTVTVANADSVSAGANYTVTCKTGTLRVSAEKVGYTVSFVSAVEASGMPEADAYTGLVSGSTLEKPADPTAEGYTFAGWYKDGGYAGAWDFENGIVESDLTLYARWTSALAVSGSTGVTAGSLSVSVADADYTGSALKPSVAVYDGDTLLTKKDYGVTYKNNRDAAAADGGYKETAGGTGSGFDESLPYAVIKGKGAYSFVLYVNFTINRAVIGDGTDESEGVTVKYTDQCAVNAKKAVSPLSSVKFKKGMKNGTDYTVTLTDADGTAQADAKIPANGTGTYTLTVTGTGNYEGSFKKTVYAADKAHLMKGASLKLGTKTRSYTGTQVTFAPASYDKASKLYYAYGSLTGTKKLAEDGLYVKLGKKSLTYGTDYNVEYESNLAAGTATLTVIGTGAYVGSRSVTFKIKGTAVKAGKLAVTESDGSAFLTGVKYTGAAITRNDVKLTYDGTPLTYGTHYTVSYKKNIKAGTATMIFTMNPRSGYTGTVKKTFKIVQ